MQRFCTTKSDTDRLADLNRCFGRAFGPDLLDDRDTLARAHPLVAPFLTDIVLAAAMERFKLTSANLATISEELLLQIVAWVHVTLPEETRLAICDVMEPALLRMARTPLSASLFSGLPHTALMKALYQLDIPATAPKLNEASDELLRWFYMDAVPKYRLHRCITRTEIEALNQSRPVNGLNLLSLLDLWALQRDPDVLAKSKFGSATGQIQAREASWTIREADPTFDFYRGAYRPRAPKTPKPTTRAGIGLDPALAETYRITLGTAQYLGMGRAANALLMAEEWGIDEGVAWALAPVASLAFALDGKAAPASLGFTIAPYAAAETLGQTLSVFLNGIDVLTVPVFDLLTRDATIAHGLPFVAGLNLLQFAVDLPLVPSIQFGTHDTRSLGVAVRRVWVA